MPGTLANGQQMDPAQADALNDQIADLKLLLALGERLAGELRLQVILDETLRAAASLCGTDMGLLSLDAGGELEPGASLGFGADFLDQVRRALPGGGSCGTCFQRGRRVVVADTEADPIFASYRD